MKQKKSFIQRIMENIYHDELSWPPSCIGVFYQPVRPNLNSMVSNQLKDAANSNPISDKN